MTFFPTIFIWKKWEWSFSDWNFLYFLFVPVITIGENVWSISPFPHISNTQVPCLSRGHRDTFLREDTHWEDMGYEWEIIWKLLHNFLSQGSLSHSYHGKSQRNILFFAFNFFKENNIYTQLLSLTGTLTHSSLHVKVCIIYSRNSQSGIPLYSQRPPSVTDGGQSPQGRVMWEHYYQSVLLVYSRYLLCKKVYTEIGLTQFKTDECCFMLVKNNV